MLCWLNYWKITSPESVRASEHLSWGAALMRRKVPVSQYNPGFADDPADGRMGDGVKAEILRC
jgi:hypothetical protein